MFYFSWHYICHFKIPAHSSLCSLVSRWGFGVNCWTSDSKDYVTWHFISIYFSLIHSYHYYYFLLFRFSCFREVPFRKVCMSSLFSAFEGLKLFLCLWLSGLREAATHSNKMRTRGRLQKSYHGYIGNPVQVKTKINFLIFWKVVCRAIFLSQLTD